MEFVTLLDPISNDVQKLFTRGAHPTRQVDWRETAEAHIIKIDMPGLKKEDVKVQLLQDGRTLRISAKPKEKEEEKGDIWHHAERPTGSFSRQLRLPENSNMDQVDAQVQDGVLTVQIRKVQQPKSQLVRQIEIA